MSGTGPADAMAAIPLFISYSKSDAEYLKEVEGHLAPLENDGLIRLWDDQLLRSGSEKGWEEELISELNAAGAIVILWSPAFARTRFCQRELSIALERKRSGSAKVFLIHLRPCEFQENVAEFTIRPSRDRAVSSEPNPDAALLEIVKEIRRELKASSKKNRQAEVASESGTTAATAPTGMPGAVIGPPARLTTDEPGSLAGTQVDSSKAAFLELLKTRTGRAAVAIVGALLIGLAWTLSQLPLRLGDSIRSFVNPVDGLTYVWIPPGEFKMGCSPGDEVCEKDKDFKDELPRHSVRITKGFWMSESEVTQKAYQKVIGSNSSRFPGADLPVEQVTWGEAVAYCKAVGGRLPTEAEWEYAARGGGATSRYGELGKIAWSRENSYSKTHPVKGLLPNRFGLYDMLGNVLEWTGDWYAEYQTEDQVDPKGPANGTQRVLRGGACFSLSLYTRASLRVRFVPGDSNYIVGIRCARD